MKILIDFENILFHRGSFEQVALKFFSDLEKQFPENFKTKTNFEEEFQKLLEINDDIGVQDLLGLIFEKFEKELFFEKIKVRLRKYHSSKNKELHFYKQTSNFEMSDLKYLQIHYHVYFVGFNQKKIEQLFIQCAFEEFLEIFKFDDDITPLVDQQSFIVSQRPSFWNEKFQEKINFPKRFIYAYNYHVKPEIKKQENEIANMLDIKWDLLSLKGLFNKIKIITRWESGDKKVKKYKKVGIFGDSDFMEFYHRSLFFQDGEELIFEFMDPFDLKNHNLNVDAFYCKFSYLMKYYNIIEDKDIHDKLTQLDFILRDLESKSGKKIYEFNKYNLFEIFVDRQKLYEFFNNVFQEENIKQKLHLEGLNLSFPKTIEINEQNFPNALQLVKQNGLVFPVLIKTKWAANSLSEHCHDLILLKNENALQQLVEEKKFDLSKFFPIVIQNLVDPVLYCQKLYVSFGRLEWTMFNSIDMAQYPDTIIIDGEANLKTQIKKYQYDEKSMNKIHKFLQEELEKKGIAYYGVDIINKENTNEFYIIDLNYDTLTWLRHDNNVKKILELKTHLVNKIKNNQYQKLN